MEKRAKNILIVHNYYQIPGGEDTVVENEKSLLEEHGHKAVLYTRNNSELKSLSKFRKLLLPFTTVFSFKTYREVKKIIKTEKIDVVHVHNTLALISPSVYYAAVAEGIPVVQTVHNFRLVCPNGTFSRGGRVCEDCITCGLWGAIKHKCYRHSRAQTFACVASMTFHRMIGIYKKLNYICFTEFTKEKILSLKQINQERIYIKPNFTEDLGGKGGAGKYFVFVGRLEEMKGVNLLLEAFKLMPEISLKIIGSGDLSDQIANRIEDEKISNVELLGFKKKYERNQIVKDAKALIFSSQWYETFGLTIIEAYSIGIPAIVGNIGNAKELVRDGVTGELFDYNSPTDLAKTVKTFSGNYISQMGENAYALYKEKYTAEENYSILAAIYNDVVK